MAKKLKEPIVTGLQKIQASFNEYQNSAFEKRSAHFFALELCGECGELANLEKKIWRSSEKEIKYDKLADEAADTLIALINYCNSREINLEPAVERKLKKIEKRRLGGLMGKTKS